LAPAHYAYATSTKNARDLLDFTRLFIDFAKAPELCRSKNKHAGAIFEGAPAHCPNKKKSYLFVQPNLLDIARVFLDFARTPAALWGVSKFGVSTGALFDPKITMPN